MQCGYVFAREPRLLGAFALATWTVVYHLMGKEITVDAEVAMTSGTLIATAHTHSLGLTFGD